VLEAASATAVCLPAAAAAGERNCIYLTRSNDGAVLINMATNRSLSFLPRDAMHPRYWPWVCVRVCVRLSVTSRCSIETVERIELVFGV